MKVAVCIASRGRPDMFYATVRRLTDAMDLPDTIIAAAIDIDDPDRPAYHTYYQNTSRLRVVYSVAEREDSLGAKYNRAQHQVRADLYVLWADDMTMPDEGWDAKLSEAAEKLPDQCGVVLFGNISGVLQPGIAMTQKFIDAQGFFNVPYFPYWWGETWPMEIATMSGRFAHADIRVELLTDVKGKSRGVREIVFWAELFDRLRPSRIKVAKKIINSGSEPLLHKRELLAKLPAVAAAWEHSNAVLRDPVRAAELERHYSFDAPADERYMRLKAKAEKMLEELNGRA